MSGKPSDNYPRIKDTQITAFLSFKMLLMLNFLVGWWVKMQRLWLGN